MKALVTGGAGFIGSHLVEALIRRRHAVRVLDDLSSGTLRNLASVRGRVDFLRGDVRNRKILKRALRGVDVVFHQGALRSVPKSVQDPAGYHAVNTTATLHLLELAAGQRVRRVIYASSSSVYGEKTAFPQKETFECAPQSPYAASKLAGEIYCRMFSRLYGLPTVCLRYFNVFGPRQSLESQYAVAIPKFIVSLLSGAPPPIYGDGRQTRDFTHVDNVVQANLKAATAKRATGEVFNVASGERNSVLDVVRTLKRLTGTKVEPCFLPPRPGDVRHTWADIAKAKRLMGYRVETPFSEGLRRTLEWFRAHPEDWKPRG